MRDPRLLALVLSVIPALADGVAAQSYAFEQLTEQPIGLSMFEPTISADGEHVAFRTNADLTGENPDLNFEVFVLEVATGAVLQLTETPAGFAQTTPMIAPDGSFVVFRSAFDFTGQNRDGLFELFEVDVASSAVRQLTTNPPGVSVFDPVMSTGGDWIVYRMFGDPVGLNADGNFEIFRLHRDSRAITQLTQTTSGNREHPTVSADGTRVAFAARADDDGSNPNGNLEIWLWDELAGTITAVTRNPTSTWADHPSIDDAGRHVSFLSPYDFTGGDAPGVKVHVADLVTGAIRLVTATGTGNPYLGHLMAPDGERCLFESDRDLLGSNSDGGRELFVFETATGTLSQLTDTPAGLSANQLDEDLLFRYVDVAANTGAIAYRSEQNLDPSVANGGAGANLELFVARLGGCGAERFANGAFAAAGTPFSPDFDLGFGFEPGVVDEGQLRVAAAPPNAPLLVAFALAPAVPAGGPPLWLDTGSLGIVTLVTDASGALAAPLSLSDGAIGPVAVYTQTIGNPEPGRLQFSNGLRLTFCP